MMPPFVVFPTNRIAHFVEVSLYLFYLAQRVKLSHSLGNFGLVPAYFNAYRGRAASIRDYLPQSLYFLAMNQESNYSIIDNLTARIRNQKYKNGNAAKYFQEYSNEMFKKYINTMFLWDLVQFDKNGNAIVYDYTGCQINNIADNFRESNLKAWADGAERFIKRRGIFMASLLYAYYYALDEFKAIIECLYVDEEITLNGKKGFDAVFELIEPIISSDSLRKVFKCARELIKEVKSKNIEKD